MKTKFTALALITVTALSFAPKPAAANDKGLAIVGGFIGGLIVAAAINDSHHDDYSSQHTVVVDDRYAGQRERCDARAPNGYWSSVSVNVWLPGCWVVERSSRGRDCRRYVEGHYERRMDRVWVSNDHRNRNNNHDREVSYGYGNRR